MRTRSQSRRRRQPQVRQTSVESSNLEKPDNPPIVTGRRIIVLWRNASKHPPRVLRDSRIFYLRRLRNGGCALTRRLTCAFLDERQLSSLLAKFCKVNTESDLLPEIGQACLHESPLTYSHKAGYGRETTL
ncbi:hypothetical protein Tco_1409061 [Tanacetum coccineum]